MSKTTEESRARTLHGFTRWVAAGALAITAGAGCGAETGAGPDKTGTASLALTQVPADVSCLQVTAVGVRSVEQRFDVQAGEKSVLQMGGVPVGDVSFNASAYPAKCADLGPGAQPNWVGDPVKAAIQPGQVTGILIGLRPNGQAVVGVDFLVDDKTGELCVGNQPGCLDPADAIGGSGAPPPSGARLISSAEFGRLLNAGTLNLASPNREQKQETTDEEQARQDRLALEALLQQANIPLSRVIRKPILDDRLKPLPDGNFRFTIDTENERKVPVITHGERFAVSEALAGLRRFDTRENQLGIYENTFQLIPADVRERLQLQDPKLVAQLPPGELVKLNESITKQILDLAPWLVLDLPPAGYPSSCAAEEGAPASPTDQTGSVCSPKPTGIWDQHKFPLKWYATCVKNQANRGTCVSFGISAAAEAAVAVKHNRWKNLSEQRLYYWAKFPTSFGDGLSTSGTLSSMVSSNFLYPFEHRWDYNPSSSREVVEIPPFIKLYQKSCLGYSGEHCSDTSHQGEYVCVDIGILRFCGYDGSATADAGVKLTGNLQLFSLFGTSLGLDLAKLMVGLKVPLVMALDVTPSFDGATSNGVVTYVGSGEDSRGGHAVAVMGYVDNAKLPANIPAGSGGGYLIVKNSWGKCWKDGGYVYLPYNWVKDYAYMLSTVKVN